VVFPIDAALGQAVVRHVEPLLALAAANDLAERERSCFDCRSMPHFELAVGFRR